ncbi:MAG: hypothetical protein ACK4IX_18230, partial [Candidatus Sericytochromatia bacterium]
MPKYSVYFIKTAFIYFIFGTILGATLLINKAYNFNPLLWNVLPIHIEILFIGWFLQFILGVAYWIMPKYFSTKSYGNENLIKASYLLINLGLIIKTSLYYLTSNTFYSLSLIFFLPIFIGVILFASNIWLRVRNQES